MRGSRVFWQRPPKQIDESMMPLDWSWVLSGRWLFFFAAVAEKLAIRMKRVKTVIAKSG